LGSTFISDSSYWGHIRTYTEKHFVNNENVGWQSFLYNHSNQKYEQRKDILFWIANGGVFIGTQFFAVCLALSQIDPSLIKVIPSWFSLGYIQAGDIVNLDILLLLFDILFIVFTIFLLRLSRPLSPKSSCPNRLGKSRFTLILPN
jgi:hypothetical protein